MFGSWSHVSSRNGPDLHFQNLKCCLMKLWSNTMTNILLSQFCITVIKRINTYLSKQLSILGWTLNVLPLCCVQWYLKKKMVCKSLHSVVSDMLHNIPTFWDLGLKLNAKTFSTILSSQEFLSVRLALLCRQGARLPLKPSSGLRRSASCDNEKEVHIQGCFLPL